jgi:sugar phosphate isomerase/epimerase
VPLTHRPVLTETQWTLLETRLTALADAVDREGLAIAYHHHMGTVVQTEAEIDRLMSMTDPHVGLLLDTGHATFAGGDPVALARRHRERIVHVHCKDVRAAVMQDALRGGWSFLDSVVAGIFTVPGDGNVDFSAVLAELPGYGGWLVVEAEQDPAKAHPLTYARMGHDNLAGLAARAGLL